MDAAIFMQIGLGMAGGFAVTLAFYGVLTLKLFRLRFQLETIQQTLLTIQNRGKAAARWEKRDLLEQELQGLKPYKNEHSERYANDPLTMG